MIINPFSLRNEAKNEIYDFIDKNIRPLPKNSNGIIDETLEGFNNNDVDALRHAYVSGVFTMAYNESVANIFGRINELFPGGSSTENPEKLKKQENMDLWNNEIGRNYGRKCKTREELKIKLLKALKNNELIIDLNDSRKFRGEPKIKRLPRSFVIVIEESNSGENLTFFDLNLGVVLNKLKFVEEIRLGNYPGYELRVISGQETPVSKRDRLNFNNLG